MQHDPSRQEDFNTVHPLTRSRTFSGTTGQHGVRLVLLSIADELSQPPKIPEGLRENTELVLAEVLNNIEEHSYQGRDGGRLKVKLGIRSGEIDVETQDFGVPMPGLNVPQVQEPNPDAPRNDLQEGGFGWYLIHTLAPCPVYCRRGQTNILRFTVTNA